MTYLPYVWKVFLIYAVLHSKYFSTATDYTLFPGHLQPLGSHQVQHRIEEVNEFPEPRDFFANYVDKSKPLLIKGGAKKSPAYTLWTDEYLQSNPLAETTKVFVEMRKKENRSAGGGEIPLKDFIQRYKKDDIYMVQDVPQHMQKDVLLPEPLRCNETREFLETTVLWFSSGGTKSHLHNDNIDNINCLFRGSKQLMMIEYPKYLSKVLIDKPNGGYSQVDVERVDFTKYHGLAEVEFVNATMEEGDCLFIPFKWFHQVNSFSNENSQNVAVNVWFTHVRNHRPKQCDIPSEEATLDKYSFRAIKKEEEAANKDTSETEGEAEEEQDDADLPWLPLANAVSKVKGRRMDFNKFLKVYEKVIFRTKVFRNVQKEYADQLKSDIQKVFNILDDNKDGIFDDSDVDELDGKEDQVNDELLNLMAAIDRSLEDHMEQQDIEESAAQAKDEL